MAGQTDTARLDTVASGDIISLQLSDDAESAARQYKVVHKDSNDSAIIVTLEGDDGETLDVELPADTVVNRSLESKWESAQSPTPHE